ncbi:uncharacterized protein LOC135928695 [Gordionus sp. m RMFG-2023]|uniref:uncharacterized protein LOC135928695 n=1 Tax=Gordionus sp. m RMFG-2023 TaxID=3053472 RepID=UPI0031FD2E21
MANSSLKALWKNLRDFFMRERLKMTKLMSGSQADHHISWPYYQDMLFLVETVTPRLQLSSLDMGEGFIPKDVNNIFNEIIGETNEFDCIDSDLIIDIIIPKGPPLQLSNECESIFSDSIISYCKYPKRNNEIDEIKTLLKLEHEKTILELEMTKNRYNEREIRQMQYSREERSF